jgi:hypothetical protein
VSPITRGTRREACTALIEVVRVTVERHGTRVPAPGSSWVTDTHFASALPGPRVLKNSCAAFMAA